MRRGNDGKRGRRGNEGEMRNERGNEVGGEMREKLWGNKVEMREMRKIWG